MRPRKQGKKITVLKVYLFAALVQQHGEEDGHRLEHPGRGGLYDNKRRESISLHFVRACGIGPEGVFEDQRHAPAQTWRTRPPCAGWFSACALSCARGVQLYGGGGPYTQEQQPVGDLYTLLAMKVTWRSRISIGLAKSLTLIRSVLYRLVHFF